MDELMDELADTVQEVKTDNNMSDGEWLDTFVNIAERILEEYGKENIAV